MTEEVATTWKTDLNAKGAFVRRDATFRNRITADGSTPFEASRGRYHVYVSLACPWAHRVLIVRKLKGLEDVISTTCVDWFMGEHGWTFTDQKPQCSLDTVNGCSRLSELYYKVKKDNDLTPDYDGRFTVPLLWDKETKTIVNNESSEIIRMLNTEFNEFCSNIEQKELNLYPEELQAEIDDVNGWIYPNINNGVYKCGFARSQEAYDEAVGPLFEALDKVEAILTQHRYLVGDRLTEADIRLFTTLVRFDKVYHGHFKCNKKMIKDYPNLWGFVRDIYQTAGISDTVDMEHITKHYMQSHKSINPFGIVSVGPDLDFNQPHGRESMAV